MGGGSASETNWRATRRCDSGQCVEVGTLGESVMIRSSADPDGMRIALGRGEWQEFVTGVKAGEFDGL